MKTLAEKEREKGMIWRKQGWPGGEWLRISNEEISIEI